MFKKSLFLIAGALYLLICITGCGVPSTSSGGGGGGGGGSSGYNDIHNLSLRDTGPAGGLIFYINPNADADGWKYLEAAPQSTEWNNKAWGKNGTLVSSNATAIGTGKNNTELIVAVLDANPPDSDRAAQLCNDLEVVNNSVTYNNWFLPSKDELYEMCWVLHSRRWDVAASAPTDNPTYGTSRVGGFSEASNYVSSSEVNSTRVWQMYFLKGEQYDVHEKNTLTLVRAIRSF